MQPRHAGWAGIALGFVAWFIALPPVLARTPVPSILIGLLAMTAGAWAIAGGEKRLGWGAVVAGLVGGAGAVAATESGVGNLNDVVTWSALVAATLRYATPLTFGALGGIISERSGVVNIALEGMMLTGAFFGIFGADLLDSWFLGLLVGMAAGGVVALLYAFFAIHLRADQIVGGTAINFLALGITGYIFLDHYGDQGTPDNVPRVPDISIPGIKNLSFFGDAIGKANLLTWVALDRSPWCSRSSSSARRRGSACVPSASIRGRPRRWASPSSARAIWPWSARACSRPWAGPTCRSPSSARSTRG